VYSLQASEINIFFLVVLNAKKILNEKL